MDPDLQRLAAEIDDRVKLRGLNPYEILTKPGSDARRQFDQILEDVASGLLASEVIYGRMTALTGLPGEDGAESGQPGL